MLHHSHVPTGRRIRQRATALFVGTGRRHASAQELAHSRLATLATRLKQRLAIGLVSAQHPNQRGAAIGGPSGGAGGSGSDQPLGNRVALAPKQGWNDTPGAGRCLRYRTHSLRRPRAGSVSHQRGTPLRQAAHVNGAATDDVQPVHLVVRRRLWVRPSQHP